MIGIVDYSVGNIGSLRNALTYMNIPCVVKGDVDELSYCKGLILPGVGAFQPAMERLDALDLATFLQEWANSHRPLMGICLGMQLLLDQSEEDGLHKGLGLIRGNVTKLQNAPRAIHIGWNQVVPAKTSGPSFEKGYAYFVHSYVCQPTDQDAVIGKTSYGDSFVSMLQLGNIMGVQFHPEKSQEFGLAILREFSDGCV
ncbi:MAG: imidazole glycerol phosphate synthase subunit HisH [Candidatus Marinimicrobia bacterium]|nr:imidazole glycerol phosphate synthase subunit HisH [Candidatus Neomarinimicrobiota bacterium]MDP6592977.1 imidazole glycerol phosphate synthase subunit HisH [Candidatus Neomarinimicrobiota bacterium]MDP6835937.1 imidazole glycerol phosphate synthase subunit HisH [Candidatus Neomarinimicrobiota bacterium]MDP6965978.1 imidazole glycerol phosphate synthase subunit HisH [Candidatus Neomarinimicrobiota bacterium]